MTEHDSSKLPGAPPESAEARLRRWEQGTADSESMTLGDVIDDLREVLSTLAALRQSQETLTRERNALLHAVTMLEQTVKEAKRERDLADTAPVSSGAEARLREACAGRNLSDYQSQRDVVDDIEAVLALISASREDCDGLRVQSDGRLRALLEKAEWAHQAEVRVAQLETALAEAQRERDEALNEIGMKNLIISEWRPEVEKVEHLESAARAAWQPISTAPKDGTAQAVRELAKALDDITPHDGGTQAEFEESCSVLNTSVGALLRLAAVIERCQPPTEAEIIAAHVNDEVPNGWDERRAILQIAAPPPAKDGQD